MRPFRKFFFLSLAFFLFLFFAKFLVLAFIVAAVLTFLSYAFRGMRRHADYEFRTSQAPWLSRTSRYHEDSWIEKPEPLFIARSDRDDRWKEDFRSITVY